MPTLTDLPVGVRDRVASMLPPRDVAALRMTARGLRATDAEYMADAAAAHLRWQLRRAADSVITLKHVAQSAARLVDDAGEMLQLQDLDEVVMRAAHNLGWSAEPREGGLDVSCKSPPLPHPFEPIELYIGFHATQPALHSVSVHVEALGWTCTYIVDRWGFRLEVVDPEAPEYFWNVDLGVQDPAEWTTSDPSPDADNDRQLPDIIRDVILAFHTRVYDHGNAMALNVVPPPPPSSPSASPPASPSASPPASP